MNEDTDIDALLAQCRSDDPDARITGIHELERRGRHHAQKVGPVLAQLLSDPDWSVRNNAAGALGVLRYTAARPSLERMLLHDEHATPRAAAAEALGELGDRNALEALIEALLEDDYAVRAYAAMAIGLIGERSALPALHERLTVEPHPLARVELIAASLRLGEESAFDAMMALARTADEELISNLCNALDDLLYRNTPPVILKRADELDAQLATWKSERLRARLAELRSDRA